MEPSEGLRVYDGGPSNPVATQQAVQEQQARAGGVRTALSIEIRDGVLCAFMPPVEKLEDYLELLTVVESSAEEMAMQVHVEGYPPPYDPRVEVIKVTPDPCVIDVNVQPAASLGHEGARAAVAGRPVVPAYPGRYHRQDPSRGNLYRQAVFAGWAARSSRAGGVSRAGNAARSADVIGAAALGPRADRKALARAAA